jgi:replicative DNA helicase
VLYITSANTKLDVDKQTLETVRKIKEYKQACEANIVSILWKSPELFFAYDNLKLDDFTYNEWKVYWTIGKDIVANEEKPHLDDITVGLYLEKHPKLKEKYDKYGGFQTIDKAKTYVKIDNLDGYVKELKKWNVVLELVKRKFPIGDRISDFVDMSAEEIYEEYEAILNHVFINVEYDDKTYDIADGIHELIDKLDEGFIVGLPIHNSPILTKEINGHELGSITLIGGLSGVGKSSFVRNTTLPSILLSDEKIVIMINEEGRDKWQRELLVWVANTIYKKDLQKYTVRDGKYIPEVKALLHRCGDWIEEHRGQIMLKPFEKYTTSQAVKTIRKYCSMGIKYFVLDTFKADSNKTSSDAFWLDMQQGMVSLYDVIKPENKNVHLTVTFQLSKSSSKQRYYTQENIGMAKNIVDVASTCIMMRKLFEDEYEGGNKAIQAYRLEGKYGMSKIPIKLTKGKHYQILFIVKNREGATNEYQIVIEHDLSRNIYKEVGICYVEPDF